MCESNKLGTWEPGAKADMIVGCGTALGSRANAPRELSQDAIWWHLTYAQTNIVERWINTLECPCCGRSIASRSRLAKTAKWPNILPYMGKWYHGDVEMLRCRRCWDVDNLHSKLYPRGFIMFKLCRVEGYEGAFERRCWILLSMLLCTVEGLAAISVL